MTTPNNLGTASGKVTIHTGQALAALVKLRAQSASSIGTLNTLGRAGIVAGGALAGMGGAVAYGLYRAARVAADFEFKMSFLQATLKATDDQMYSLRQSALEFGQVSGFGPREIADAFVELGKAGVSAEQIIGGVGRAVITLGQSADIGLAQAASIIVSTQATFQLLASEAQHTADVIQGAANASLIDVADFGTTMKYVGNVAAAVGIDLDDLSVAIAEVGNQGIRGSTAGTSLRRMLLQLTPRTDKAKAAMEDLGIITEKGTNLFYDETGSAKSLRDIFEVLHQKTLNLTDAKKKDALATIFGDRAIATALATAKGGAKLYDEFQAQIAESTAAEIAAKRFDNLQGSIRKLKGALEGAFITTGETEQRSLQRLVENATALVNIFAELRPETQQLIVKIALLTAGTMLVIGAFSILLGTVARAVAIFKQLRAASLILTTSLFGASTAAAVLASALTGGLLLGIAAVIANIGGLAAGAAEASRKIQEVEAGLNFGDIKGLHTATQELLDFAAAKAKAVGDKSLWEGVLGVFSGSNTRDLRAANDAMKEADRLAKKASESTRNLHEISRVSKISFKDLANSAKAANLDMSGSVHDNAKALLEYYEKTVKGRVSSKQLAAAVTDIAESADEATGEVKSLDQALNDLAAINLDAEQAQLAFERAVSDAKESIGEAGKVYSKNGKLLHEGNKESEDARSALFGIAEAGLDLYSSQVKANKSSSELNKTMGDTRQKFIDAAVKMGMSQAAAKRYADEIGLIPPAKPTAVKITGAPGAKKELKDIDTQLAEILKKLKDISDYALDELFGDFLAPKGDPGSAPKTPVDPLAPPTIPTGVPAKPKVAPSTIPSNRTPASPRSTVNANAAVAPQPIVVPQSNQTTYELNGPVIASDPAELRRALQKRQRIASLRGG